MINGTGISAMEPYHKGCPLTHRIGRCVFTTCFCSWLAPLIDLSKRNQIEYELIPLSFLIFGILGPRDSQSKLWG